MSTADLYNNLSSEVKDWLAKENPVFETMAIPEIYATLNKCRECFPSVNAWLTFVPFCREHARAGAAQADFRTYGWLKNLPVTIKADVNDIDFEDSMIIRINNVIAGYFCYNKVDKVSSLVWSVGSENWLTKPKDNKYGLGAPGSKKLIFIDTLIEAYESGIRDLNCTHKQRKHNDSGKTERNVQQTDSAVQRIKSTSITRSTCMRIPDDAVEIIETLFGIAGTVNILELNIQRWRNRMEELFPGQFTKGEQK